VGSSSIPLCLVASYGVTEDTDDLVQLGHQLIDWQTDFPSANWVPMAVGLRKMLADPDWMGYKKGWVAGNIADGEVSGQNLTIMSTNLAQILVQF
jgi:hypothetical protein